MMGAQSLGDSFVQTIIISVQYTVDKFLPLTLYFPVVQQNSVIQINKKATTAEQSNSNVKPS